MNIIVEIPYCVLFFLMKKSNLENWQQELFTYPLYPEGKVYLRGRG